MTEAQRAVTADAIEQAAYRYFQASVDAASARASYMLAMTSPGEFPQPPVPTPAPVEVPMRVVPCDNEPKSCLIWQIFLADRAWFGLPDSESRYATGVTDARANGERFLAGLSAQLGVKLVAKWQDDATEE